MVVDIKISIRTMDIVRCERHKLFFFCFTTIPLNYFATFRAKTSTYFQEACLSDKILYNTILDKTRVIYHMLGK